MSTPPVEPLRIGSREGRWVLLATILASSMSFLDSTVVNVALPTLQREFEAELSSVACALLLFAVAAISFVELSPMARAPDDRRTEDGR